MSARSTLGATVRHMTLRVGVLFPDSDTAAVERFRAQWDPIAAHVPAHVTVAFPFDDDRDIDDLAREFRIAVTGMAAFPVELETPTAWDDEYFFLLATQGAAEITALHNALYQGPLLGQPRPAQFTPHMTVGRTGEVVLAVAAAQAMKLATRGLVRAMSIYRVEPKGRREIEVHVPLMD